MKKTLRALKSLIAFGWIISSVFLCLPVQVGQAVSGPATTGNSVSTYGVNLLEPFQSGFLLNNVLSLPLTIQNTGDSVDQFSVVCVKVSGGNDWSVSLVNSSEEQLIASCLAGSYSTPPVPAGGSLTIYVHLEAPDSAQIGDYLRLNVKATSGSDPSKNASVVRQAAVSAPFIQNFSDSAIGRRLQVSNPKFFFTRLIGPRIEWPNSLAVVYLDHYRYINAWGYGLGSHVNIEYEVMNIISGYPPSVVQLTDNPDRTIDHSTALAAAPNGITGVAFIRTIYDINDTSRQKQNVYFARIDARGLPLGTPVNITNNPYFGISTDANVPFFSEVSIHATSNNRFILVWAKLENGKQDIYESIFNSVISAPVSITTATDTISYASPNLAGLDFSAQSFLTYIKNEVSKLPVLWGAKLDNNGAKVGADFQIAAINGSKIDTVQLSGSNILAAWIDEPSKSPAYCIWNTSGTIVKKSNAACVSRWAHNELNRRDLRSIWPWHSHLGKPDLQPYVLRPVGWQRRPSHPTYDPTQRCRRQQSYRSRKQRFLDGFFEGSHRLAILSTCGEKMIPIMETNMKIKTQGKRSEKGQSLIELGFGIVVLLVILAGIVDIGRMLFFYISLRDAAQEGAVFGQINPRSCDQITNRINEVTGNSLSNPPEIFIDGISCISATDYDNRSCSGKEIKIALNAPFTFSMPLMGGRTINLRTEITGTILRPACSD